MVYLKNDYELAHEISSGSALKAIEMVRSESGFIIYKEYFDGIPLESYLTNKEFGIPYFYNLNTDYFLLLKELHNKKIL